MNYPLTIKRYGRAESLPKRHLLRAGPLSLLYEAGYIRQVRLDSHEIIRMIYHAVRDQNWATIPFVIDEEDIRAKADSFQIRYQGHCQKDPVSFQWTCQIDGNPDGIIRFQVEGEAKSEFHRNRIGLCILHPIEKCAGQPCTIIHPDGSKTTDLFPESISPHQPFLAVHAMEWPISRSNPERLTARLEFEGDVFETEDQRNWTDASYKTYCTPLSRSIPVIVRPGDRVKQAVTLYLPSFSSIKSPPSSNIPEVIISITDGAPVPFPMIGLAHYGQPIDDSSANWLNESNFSHLRVNLFLNDPEWSVDYRKAKEEAIRLHTKLEIVLYFNRLANYDLYSFLKEATSDDPIYAILLLSNVVKTTPAKLLDEIVGPLRNALPGVLIGAGTDAFFAELNRVTLPTNQIDFLSFPSHPQAHASDNGTIMENAEGLFYAVTTARRSVPRVHVSPVTLKARFNPDVTKTSVTATDTLLNNIEPRQMCLFGAAWTVACLKALCRAQVDSITFYETIGEHGLLQGEWISYPDLFPTQVGMIFPAYWVFRAVNEFQGGSVHPIESRWPLKVEALLLRKGEQFLLLLANLTDEQQQAQIELPQSTAVQRLDENTFDQAAFSPDIFAQQSSELLTPSSDGIISLELNPYAVIFCRGLS